jgi:hypothetical protein
LKKVPVLLLIVLPASLMCLSCGTSTPNGSLEPSAKYRAFVTNEVSAGTLSAGIYIVDAETDVRVSASISAGNTPGMMVLTPSRAQTLVFSGNGTETSDNVISIVDNAKQSTANRVTLPGMTESFVVSPDSSTAYVAVPTAQVTGQSPGAIEVIGLGSGAITASISCPPVNPANPVCVWPGTVPQGFNPPYRYLAIGNTGTRLLAFSEGQDSVANVVAVITPSSVGTEEPVVTFVPGFDHPVAAFFSSDDSIAYILNCGAECGGQQASVQQLNLTNNTLGSKVAVCVPNTIQCAGSAALVNGSTMYVAGTPVRSQPCTGETTAAQSCGLLTVVDLSKMAVTNSGIVITDGYHTRLSLASNGQLFIGASACTEISTTTETRGCLSIYNTLPETTVGSNPPGGVLIPPENGDVTGLQPVATRTVVYLVQGGTFYIYDTTTDALLYNASNPGDSGKIVNLVGDFVDVITPDF